MPPNKSFVCVHAAKSAAKALKIFELHDEIVRRETELAELKFQLEVLVSVIEYKDKENRVGRAGLKTDCSAVTSSAPTTTKVEIFAPLANNINNSKRGTAQNEQIRRS